MVSNPWMRYGSDPPIKVAEKSFGSMRVSWHWPSRTKRKRRKAVTNSKIDSSAKIRPEHLERKAFVYVRQSSLSQVRDHVEGRLRQ